MGTKTNPGRFDCYAKARPDEPLFVLLGRDPLAAELVDAWAERRAQTRGCRDPKVLEALLCALAMRDYHAQEVEGMADTERSG